MSEKPDTRVDRYKQFILGNKYIAIVIVIGIIVIAVGAFFDGVTKTINFWKFISGSESTETSRAQHSSAHSDVTTSLGNVKEDAQSLYTDQRLDNCQKYVILDGNLYVGLYYASFMIGGVNKDVIKIAARSEKAEPLPISVEHFINPNLSRYEDDVVLVGNVVGSPYIELEYKGRFYSLRVDARMFGISDATHILFSMDEIESPTMILSEYGELPVKE